MGVRAPPPPHHQARAARSSALDDEVFDQHAIERRRARGRGRRRAARRARAQPHRPHGRHRRDHPGRTGRGDPRRHRRRARRRAAARAPARPRSRCTAPRTSSTRTAAGSRRQGVLLVGPSAVFLRYIEQVLPSLGEQDVQLSTITGLKPRLRATRADAADVARAEGRRAAWPSVIERAVADRERPLASEVVLVIDGLRRPHHARRHGPRRRRHAARRRGTHNEKRPLVARRIIDMLVARYKEALVRTFREHRFTVRPRPRVRRHRQRHEHLRPRRRARPHRRAARSHAARRRPKVGSRSCASRSAGPPRGEGSARAHVAGALGRRARQRLFGFSALVAFGGATACSTTTSRRCLHRRRDPTPQHVAVDRGRRRARRRGRRAARAGRGRAPAAPAPARVARTRSTPRTA